jgi:hypothetical protein
MPKSTDRVFCALASLTIWLSTTACLRAEDEKDKPLEALKNDLPKIFERAEFPPLIMPGKKVPDEPFFRLMSANRFEESRAKITIGAFLDSSQKEPHAVIVLYVTSFKDKWTVYQHESSSYFDSGEGKDKKLILIALIDSR